MNLEKLTIYSVCLCLFFLTFQIEITNATLIILVFLNFVHIISTKSLPVKRITTNGLIFIGLFILQAISLLYTNNIDEGLKQTERQLLLLIMPFIFLFIPDKKENLVLFKQFFFMGGVFSVIYTLIASVFISKLFMFLSRPEPLDSLEITYLIKQFTYHGLARHVGGHALYFANYLSFTSIVGLTLYFKEESNKRKKAYLIGIVLQIIVIFLLKSVTIILGFTICLVLIIFVFIDTKKTKNKAYFSFIFSMIFIVLTHVFLIKSRYYRTHFFSSHELISFYLPAFVLGLLVPLIIIFIVKQKKIIIISCTLAVFLGGITSLVIYSKTHPSFLDYTNNYNNINSRYGTGLAALSNIKQHPILGVGIGSSQDCLTKWYEANNFKIAIEEEYNEHNQYLRYWLSSGVLALLLYLVLLAYNITKGIKYQDYTLICLTILLSLFSLTESCLTRNKGMLFFVILFCVYDIFHKKK